MIDFARTAGRALLAALIAGWTLVHGAPSSAAEPPFPASTATPWLLVSDIHFNPFDDRSFVDALTQAPATEWHGIFARSAAPPSPYFNDTNFALFESALSAMRTNVPDPPVVFVAGDFLAHEFPEKFAQSEPGKPQADYQSFVDKTIAFLALELGAAYPKAQFVITIGNNDGYCGDYQSTPQSPFLAHMAQAWEPLVDRDQHAPNFIRDFSNGGYFTLELPGAAPAQVVVLNSVFWSEKYTNACGLARSDPGAQELDWLTSTLASRPPVNRWFLTHIPPGIDEYSSMRAGQPVPFMSDLYLKRLVAAVDANGARASEFILGHLHHATFEIVGPDDGSGVPGLVIPSISPVQGNNPAFMAAFVDPASGVIRDFTSYFLPLPSSAAWVREYSFDSAYGVAEFDTAGLEQLQSKLASDANLRAMFERNYNSQSTVAAVVPSTWPWYWCGDIYLTAADYAACVEKIDTPTPSASPR